LGGANGGAGANSTLTNAVTGSSDDGNVLTLSQYAFGGNGGNASGGGAGGVTGFGKSSLTFNDTSNPTQSGNILTHVGATGGAGGTLSGGSTAGVGGGAATATSDLTGADYVNSGAVATGGAGGATNAAASGGAGGAAKATATADSTAALTLEGVPPEAIAESIATGGDGNSGGTGEAGGGGGAATSTATATNAANWESQAIALANGGNAYVTSTDGNGGAATAFADATSAPGSNSYVPSSAQANGGQGAGTGLGGAALATAEASGTSSTLVSQATTSEASTQLITTLSASGSDQNNAWSGSSGSSESESSAKYTGAAPSFITDFQSIAQIVGDPNASSGNAVLNANPNIKTGFGSSPSFWAIGELGGSYTPLGTGATSSVSFTLNQADISSGKSLELGLYNGDELDAGGVTGISLTVTGNGTNLLKSPINSASQFTDDAINLGALGTSGMLDVVLTLTVATDAAGAGFFADFLLGDPKALASASTHSLHPAAAEWAHSPMGVQPAAAVWTGSAGHGPGPGA
jgi:hypothetical protein